MERKKEGNTTEKGCCSKDQVRRLTVIPYEILSAIITASFHGLTVADRGNSDRPLLLTFGQCRSRGSGGRKDTGKHYKAVYERVKLNGLKIYNDTTDRGMGQLFKNDII